MISTHLLLLVTEVEEKAPPEAEDVVAGWTAFALFGAMILATALICWALVRQLRRVNAAKDSGVFGVDEEADLEDITEPTDESVDSSAAVDDSAASADPSDTKE